MNMFLKWSAAALVAVALTACFDDDDNNRKNGMDGGDNGGGPVGFGDLFAQVFDRGPNDEPVAVNGVDIVDDNPDFSDQLSN